ncbi:MAG: RNA methyltransferase [Sandaracinaceae bacterium]|nr:RNA methyltransferase [Sandaracinaceae bacterium]
MARIRAHSDPHARHDTTSSRGRSPHGAEPPARPSAPRASDATRDDSSEIVFGLRACLAVLATRPQAIREVLVSADQRDAARALIAHARGHARELPDRELERVAETSHHEGVVVRTAPRAWASGKELRALLDPRNVDMRREGARPKVAVALDRVRNPYNIGAILRSAAFFGIDVAVLGAPAPHPALPPDAARVAEGGAEHLVLSRTTDLAETLAQLKKVGVRIYGAENDGAHDVTTFTIERPCVLVLGHEREGISPRVREQCDAMLAIRGTGAIQSLNVSIAASLLIHEFARTAR